MHWVPSKGQGYYDGAPLQQCNVFGVLHEFISLMCCRFLSAGTVRVQGASRDTGSIVLGFLFSSKS